MLSRHERLTTAAFTECFRSGKRTHTTFATYIVCPGTSFSCAVVVGKKVAKRAIVRNRIRRQLTALYRTLAMGVSAAVIVIVKPGVKNLSRKERARVMLLEFGELMKKR